MDTIFALATAQGRAGVAVVRVSGPSAHHAGQMLCGALPDAGCFAVRAVRAGDELLDRALVLTFAAPHSFTGEDVIELHLHGSIAILQRVLSVLGEIEGLRLAEPGEFTRRALENGKMDLAQVEGLADLIDAETEFQRAQAMQTVEGALSKVVEDWRARLIHAASLLEVTIDFADEDVPVDVAPEVVDLLAEVILQASDEVSRSYVAERVRSGFEVAIVGLPNAGKSTLLNALAGRDAAITSEFAGTTRDVIEVRMDLDGLPVTFLDTAGLRDSDDHVEAIGIERAIARARTADLRVFLTDDMSALPLTPLPQDIVVAPKADLRSDGTGVSGVTGAGVTDLVQAVKAVFSDKVAHAGLTSRERHRTSLQSAVAALETAQDLVKQGPEVYDLAAEELRIAIRSLEFLVGRIDVENLLDEIFSSFCLGK
ncbi:tRNA uridine-5-carboxymethylaminomethyl(34) synthesis GTPase MnmE [Sulfitobacter pseudonitzschiae]|uniref:tRNA modification GTPase MnmE n=1 Tax=Pseudosulfitobacter pseudonitzschiae TaxID=1402135 RepID=A0A9Q2NPA7_9RHOB|nr:tRNA uridine-5-carboxymethylaminomethyl(34) synthesis GTPase MnmE [Pseudosulfitobacter pseudonitzschiae]MBM2290615.1 tRNA uridine-5-carboxymethylaminomethyl(34) synthesis GTPase MnmE [Pseudosulfitobacter pseudonitzschiae]MBM2295533.1 tRNA uridine-5-carboxymethylaminomethyl(34) synthesis GTPase MnmE [Pseudosulfitobacter pseudonitzschiae]MBM2300445.1 tRNA uridine-5-carboxymethylaminomethyl(34) synthesis GTPase MnmE [Pseudosulfitobacter pseudonitzschiae]MBM2310230.1 tRNA uridine-5-carboxymethyl